jgi:general stress protein 26
MARSFKTSERWEKLLQETKTDSKATKELNSTDKVAFGLYLQQREAYIEINGKLPS